MLIKQHYVIFTILYKTESMVMETEEVIKIVVEKNAGKNRLSKKDRENFASAISDGVVDQVRKTIMKRIAQ